MLTWIKACVGGEESNLFVRDLQRMYSLYFTSVKNGKCDVIESGDDFVILRFYGEDSNLLGVESGIHRVQRVPKTEKNGRLHTSAVSVYVYSSDDYYNMKELPYQELRIDTYRSGGAGGQHVNKTESAVRITHIPTGIVVQCQDERSQIQNKAKAMETLIKRIIEYKENIKNKDNASIKKNIIMGGDRSDKIRTYNYKQNRVTDHRIGLSINNLSKFILGDIDKMIAALNNYYKSINKKEGEM